MCFPSGTLKYHWVNRAYSRHTWKKIKQNIWVNRFYSIAQSTLTKYITLFNSNQYCHDIINYTLKASCNLENQKGETNVI